MLSASVVSTLLTFGCQWTIVDYLSRTAISDWKFSTLQKGKFTFHFSVLAIIRPSLVVKEKRLLKVGLKPPNSQYSMYYATYEDKKKVHKWTSCIDNRSKKIWRNCCCQTQSRRSITLLRILKSPFYQVWKLVISSQLARFHRASTYISYRIDRLLRHSVFLLRIE